ncbi:hypothetical protein D0Y65_012275, partial [Glycine soja]
LLFIASSAPELRSIDFNDSASVAVTVEFPGPKPYYHFVEIIGSCRGFMLLHCVCHLCVWNPTTSVHKIIPLSPVFFNKDITFCTLLSANRAEIFSLRANAWKEIEGIHFPYIHFYYTNNNPGSLYNQFGSFLNGSIHWLAFRSDVSMNVIVVFDLVERSFSEMHLPVEFDYDNLNFCHLRVLGESPHLCAVLGCKHSVEIRVMKEYKSIVICADNFAMRYFFPICSTKSGDIIGTNVRAGLMKWTTARTSNLMKCNDKGQLQEHRTYCDSSYRSEVAVYTESLFSLPCDSE